MELKTGSHMRFEMLIEVLKENNIDVKNENLFTQMDKKGKIFYGVKLP